MIDSDPGLSEGPMIAKGKFGLGASPIRNREGIADTRPEQACADLYPEPLGGC